MTVLFYATDKSCFIISHKKNIGFISVQSATVIYFATDHFCFLFLPRQLLFFISHQTTAISHFSQNSNFIFITLKTTPLVQFFSDRLFISSKKIVSFFTQTIEVFIYPLIKSVFIF